MFHAVENHEEVYERECEGVCTCNALCRITKEGCTERINRRKKKREREFPSSVWWSFFLYSNVYITCNVTNCQYSTFCRCASSVEVSGAKVGFPFQLSSFLLECSIFFVLNSHGAISVLGLCLFRSDSVVAAVFCDTVRLQDSLLRLFMLFSFVS